MALAAAHVWDENVFEPDEPINWNDEYIERVINPRNEVLNIVDKKGN